MGAPLLSCSRKLDRLVISQKFFSVVQRQLQRSRHDTVTLDELWFYFKTGHKFIWSIPDEAILEKQRQTAQSDKVMIAVVWSSTGLHGMDVLLRGVKFNTGRLITSLLVRLPFGALVEQTEQAEK
jgi:hypothetical protein